MLGTNTEYEKRYGTYEFVTHLVEESTQIKMNLNRANCRKISEAKQGEIS